MSKERAIRTASKACRDRPLVQDHFYNLKSGPLASVPAALSLCCGFVDLSVEDEVLELLGTQRLPNLDVDGDDDALDFRSRFFVSYQIPESDSVREVVHEVAAPARMFINSANWSHKCCPIEDPDV